MADVSVRPARADDAAELGRIQVSTWRFGYRDLLPKPVLADLDEAAATAAWHAAITTPPSDAHHVLLATEAAAIVGFAAYGPANDLDPDADDLDAPAAAIAPLLVEPRWQRRGHGSRLMAAVTDHARGDGVALLISWIPEGDVASREFLVGAGWAPDGLARALDTGAGELREIRLRTSLR